MRPAKAVPVAIQGWGLSGGGGIRLVVSGWDLGWTRRAGSQAGQTAGAARLWASPPWGANRALARGWGKGRVASPVSDPRPENDQGPSGRLEAADELGGGAGQPFPIISLPCKPCSPRSYTFISVSQTEVGTFFSKTICK